MSHHPAQPTKHDIWDNLSQAQVQRAKERAVTLWPDGAPGAMGQERGDIPMLYPILPDPAQPAAAAMIVCPGGAYTFLASHEGVPVAEWLNSLGIASFVLEYRLQPYVQPVPLWDAQRALRLVRSRSNEYGIDPHRVGIIGFSAGGHLASAVATLFDAGDPDADDPVERQSSRPDAAALIYAVTDLTLGDAKRVQERTHRVLGEGDRDEELIERFSTVRQVSADTPPIFLWHNRDDDLVPYEHSLSFAQACHERGVPFELHILGYGQHGFGMVDPDPKIAIWREICANWLCSLGFTGTAT